MLDQGIFQIDRNSLKYWLCYCEENIWHLCQEPGIEYPGNKVIVISNEIKQCAIFKQRAAEVEDFVIWDYHVILLSKGLIYDLDTSLEFPTPLNTYLECSFRLGLRTKYAPIFRVIDSLEYVETFASDRHHMINQFGEFSHPPPPWPAIQPDQESNLDQLINMNEPFIGSVHRDLLQG
ncbi:MAG: hypothetical protein HQ517_04745 [SAR324 cluster bacterium]|nr:hypothetical protein [SAR324 cluster bacterium]